MVLLLTILFIAGVWDTRAEYDGSTGTAVRFSILGVVLAFFSMGLLVVSLRFARIRLQRDGRVTWSAYTGILAYTFGVTVVLSSVQWVAGFYHYQPIGPLIQGPPGPNWLQLLIGPY